MLDTTKSVLRRPPASALRALLKSEAGGGLVLMAAAAVALAIANSPFAPAYFGLLKTYVGPLSVLHWINDALMAVFFLLVGLEIKREFLDGQLSTWPRRILPGVAAAGGMLSPPPIFVAPNAGPPQTPRGWGLPPAAGIAFSPRGVADRESGGVGKSGGLGGRRIFK